MKQILERLQQSAMMQITAARAKAKGDDSLSEHYLQSAVLNAQKAAELISALG